MNKKQLILMLVLSNTNKPSKYIVELALQIATDSDLGDFVNVIDLKSKDYSVRSIKWVRDCINFTLK